MPYFLAFSRNRYITLSTIQQCEFGIIGFSTQYTSRSDDLYALYTRTHVHCLGRPIVIGVVHLHGLRSPDHMFATSFCRLRSAFIRSRIGIVLAMVIGTLVVRSEQDVHAWPDCLQAPQTCGFLGCPARSDMALANRRTVDRPPRFIWASARPVAFPMAL
jgi:hypothetical protein